MTLPPRDHGSGPGEGRRRGRSCPGAAMERDSLGAGEEHELARASALFEQAVRARGLGQR